MDSVESCLEQMDVLYERHQQRLLGMAQLETFDDALQRLVAPPPAPRSGWWASLQRRWSRTPAEPLLPHSVASRYEAAVDLVRRIGFFQGTLRNQDQEAWADRTALVALHAILAADGSPLGHAGAARAVAIAGVLDAETELWGQRIQASQALLEAATAVSIAEGRHAVAVAAGATVMDDPTALREVVRLSIGSAAAIDARADALEERMRALDEEARERRAAAAEVESWLRSAKN